MVCAEAWCLATVGSDSSQRGSEVSAVCLGDTLQVTSISGCFSGAPRARTTRNRGATRNGESPALIKCQCGICSLPESSSQGHGRDGNHGSLELRQRPLLVQQLAFQ